MAQDDLAAAKAQLQSTIAHYDERGRYWMQKIEDAEHDGLKDHGVGEWLSNEIHEHAALIKALSDALTWVVTVLVIAAMFIPIVDIGAGILLGIMAVALAGHTALALNGDGSWTDVAMDVLAMVTIGAGGLAKAGLSASAKVAGRIISAAGEGEAGEEGAAAAAKGLSEGAESSGSRAAENTIREDSKLASYKEYLGNVWKGRGEPEAAENYEKIQRAIELKPDSRWAGRVADRAAHQFLVARRASVIGNTADQVGHWGGKSDLINFGGNLLDGHGFENGDLLHPNVEGDYAPHLVPMDKFKTLTTIGINGFTGE